MLEGVLKVGVVEDEDGGFAAQLERDALEIAERRGFLDLFSRPGGAGEADLADGHVRGEEGTGWAAAADDVDDARREAGLGEQFSPGKGSERSLLGGLVDDLMSVSV